MQQSQEGSAEKRFKAQNSSVYGVSEKWHTRLKALLEIAGSQSAQNGIRL